MKNEKSVFAVFMGNRGFFSSSMLAVIGQHGFRHHVAVAYGHTANAVKEAFEKYLKYKIII